MPLESYIEGVRAVGAGNRGIGCEIQGIHRLAAATTPARVVHRARPAKARTADGATAFVGRVADCVPVQRGPVVDCHRAGRQHVGSAPLHDTGVDDRIAGRGAGRSRQHENAVVVLGQPAASLEHFADRAGRGGGHGNHAGCAGQRERPVDRGVADVVAGDVEGDVDDGDGAIDVDRLARAPKNGVVAVDPGGARIPVRVRRAPVVVCITINPGLVGRPCGKAPHGQQYEHPLGGGSNACLLLHVNTSLSTRNVTLYAQYDPVRYVSERAQYTERSKLNQCWAPCIRGNTDRTCAKKRPLRVRPGPPIDTGPGPSRPGFFAPNLLTPTRYMLHWRTDANA